MKCRAISLAFCDCLSFGTVQENVLITDSGHAKLCDFGTAIVFDKDKHSKWHNKKAAGNEKDAKEARW